MSKRAAADVDELDDFDVVRAHDLSPRLEFLSHSRQLWRRSALVFVTSSIFLFILSCIQFYGTFEACRLVHNTRQDVDKANEETARQAHIIERAAEELERSSFYHATLQEELKALHAEQKKETAMLRAEVRNTGKERDELRQLVEQLQRRLRELEKKNERNQAGK
jgi:septal ring factor EnvC (AmiA/AmiB activator)